MESSEQKKQDLVGALLAQRKAVKLQEPQKEEPKKVRSLAEEIVRSKVKQVKREDRELSLDDILADPEAEEDAKYLKSLEDPEEVEKEDEKPVKKDASLSDIILERLKKKKV